MSNELTSKPLELADLGRALGWGFLAGVTIIVLLLGGPHKVITDVRTAMVVHQNRLSVAEARIQKASSQYIQTYTEKLRSKVANQKSKVVWSLKKKSTKKTVVKTAAKKTTKNNTAKKSRR